MPPARAWRACGRPGRPRSAAQLRSARPSVASAGVRPASRRLSSVCARTPSTAVSRAVIAAASEPSSASGSTFARIESTHSPSCWAGFSNASSVSRSRSSSDSIVFPISTTFCTSASAESTAANVSSTGSASMIPSTTPGDDVLERCDQLRRPELVERLEQIVEQRLERREREPGARLVLSRLLSESSSCSTGASSALGLNASICATSASNGPDKALPTSVPARTGGH